VTLAIRVGVLALQGGVGLHSKRLQELGATPVEVRRPADLGSLDGLVLPGGESTTLNRLIDLAGLRAPLEDLVAQGLPVFGTCAGLILLAASVLDGEPGQPSLRAVDVSVRRNGYGRQRDSFEEDVWLRTPAGTRPLEAVFIRAPVIVSTGRDVETLAVLGSSADSGQPVLCRQANVLVASFHPELSSDPAVHSMFVEMIAKTVSGAGRHEPVEEIRSQSGPKLR
jgi:5'-phosphate synthase pdxT subunit